MRHQMKQLGGLAAALVLGSLVAQAQEAGFGGGLKLRTGYGLATSDENLKRRTLGFGLEFNYTDSWGRVGLELGYTYKPGNQYMFDVTDPSLPVVEGAPHPAGGGASADSRKNQVGGIGVRLSYERPLAPDFSIRGGLQIAGMKYRQEYVADVAPAALEYEDTYQGTVNKTKVTVSPFVGVSYAINETAALEFNILLLSYQSANFIHIAGSGDNTPGLITTKNHSVPHIELGYTFRF